MIQSVLMGGFGRSSPLDAYSRVDLYRIVRCLNECNLKLRSEGDECTALNLADNFFMTVCSKIEDDILSSYRRLSDE